MELSEEALQGASRAAASEVARHLDATVPTKGIGSVFTEAWESTKDAAAPLALMMLPAGAGMATSGRASYQDQQSRAQQQPTQPGPTLDSVIDQLPDVGEQESRDAQRLAALPAKLAAGETASRADAFAWERMFPDQPQLPTEQRARTEELNRRLKEIEDAVEKQGPGEIDAGGGPRVEETEG